MVDDKLWNYVDSEVNMYSRLSRIAPAYDKAANLQDNFRIPTIQWNQMEVFNEEGYLQLSFSDLISAIELTVEEWEKTTFTTKLKRTLMRGFNRT